MFYRYGSEIEMLTEKAYELRGKFKSGEKLWQYVKFTYLFENGMICNLDDCHSRFFANPNLKIIEDSESETFIQNLLECKENFTC